MVQNGYPVNLVKRKIRNTIDQHQKKTTKSTEQKKLKKALFIPITYYGNETFIMSNKIKNVIESLYPMTQVIFGYRKSLTLAKLFTKNYKGKEPMNIGVVYQLSCNNCDQVYIGQTKLNVIERMKQHKEGLQKPDTSRAADHMLNNKNHIVDFSQPKILARDINKKRREIKETILTSQTTHTYNKISHELMIFT
ncbi:unnamed protein product [Rotaria sp. Silwood2]|nr:unnamed protein product [Rotaria sp. Silwood2]CAF3384363.1 unnamed protein product [Rotaria sp. Silwood2]CAF3442357.1 unnamed protein product [Rotaria sp. Silwood2]CAF4428768.1 unnamed protein product [Rotaria sp. Silwood2]CAF4568833.1 unnamed protein product [Rotaria sp. Silwood2]